MRMLLVRHYKTIGNVEAEIIGWEESPPADGWQADLYQIHKILDKANIRFHHVYTSDLQRARKTGQFYADALSVPSILHDPALNEINYGRLSKKNKRWVEKHYPRHKKDPGYVYPDGESFLQMQARSSRFVESLARKHPNKTYLVVAHAGVIRGLIAHFLKLDYKENLRRNITHRYVGDFRLENGRCISYNELGNKSGFVEEDVIKFPWHHKKR